MSGCVVMTRQQHPWSRVVFQTNFKLQSLSAKLMLLLLVLNTQNIRPSMAESEANNLNTWETSRQSDFLQTQISSKLERRQSFPEYSGFMPPTQTQFPAMQYAGAGGGCPLCDSSVYSYCALKLVHDSCCCDYPGNIYQKPPQCAYYNCSLLYAKSCYEHSLIKTCCCNNPY